MRYNRSMDIMNKERLMKTVKTQLARDFDCAAEDFEKHGITFAVHSNFSERVTPTDLLKIISFYSAAVVTCDSHIKDKITELLKDVRPELIFDQILVKAIANCIYDYNAEVDDVCLYFIPDFGAQTNVSAPEFKTEFYTGRELERFRGRTEFSDALPFNNIAPDVMAIAAVENNRVVGLAGASRSSEKLWEVGVNVLPEFRGHHIASKLIELLKNKVLDHNAVPYYRTAVSHILSQNVAINAGFKPAWSSLTTRPKRNIDIRPPLENEIAEIKGIYIDCFPEAERIPFEKVCEFSELYGLYRKKETVGFMTSIERDGYVLLDFFGIKRDKRGKGLGRSCLTSFLSDYADKNGVIIETELPGSDTTESENMTRINRQNFYSKIGFIHTGEIISDNGVRLELMYFPINKNPRLIFPVFSEIYKQSYGLKLYDKRIKKIEE